MNPLHLDLVSPRFGYVSTYPPTVCGLATFTASLVTELSPEGDSAGRVVRLLDDPQPSDRPEVGTHLVGGDLTGLPAAVTLLEQGDVALIQHEYGVFGGRDGDDVLELLRALTVPTIVVLHTVLTAPSTHQRAVLEEVARLADALVVMSHAAEARLTSYDVDMGKVSLIPHGTPAPTRRPHARTEGPLTVLTWGLIGPGKGIQWAVEAMAHLTDLDAQYVVAGRTHPKVLLHEGEAYRERLQGRVDALGLAGTVHLDGRYRDAAALEELVDAADVVLLPYDSTDQVTSGVLIEAVAAGKPVVATRFPHAVELLAGGAGLLVPHQDPAAIAAALRSVLTSPALAAGMRGAAAASASEVLWPAVAARYRLLAQQLLQSRVAA